MRPLKCNVFVILFVRVSWNTIQFCRTSLSWLAHDAFSALYHQMHKQTFKHNDSHDLNVFYKAIRVDNMSSFAYQQTLQTTDDVPHTLTYPHRSGLQASNSHAMMFTGPKRALTYHITYLLHFKPADRQE